MLTSLVLASLHAQAVAAPPIRGGRPAIGVSGATGIAVVEPTWTRPTAAPSALACAGVTGWWIYGGHDYAGRDGEVLRASDGWRIGGSGAICPTAGGGTNGGVGMGFGRQWGTNLYLSTHATVGLSVFGKEGPRDSVYTAIAPYAKPTVSLGLSFAPGMSLEAGPYLWIAPPLFQAALADVPAGFFVGHAGLEATVLVGNASPRAFF